MGMGIRHKKRLEGQLILQRNLVFNYKFKTNCLNIWYKFNKFIFIQFFFLLDLIKILNKQNQQLIYHFIVITTINVIFIN